MGYGGGAGGGELADGSPRQGNFRGAEFVGPGLCRCGAGSGAGGAVFRMEGGVLCGDSAGAADAVDSARSAGVRDVGGARVEGTTQLDRQQPWRRWPRPNQLHVVDWKREILGDLSCALCKAYVCFAAFQLLRHVCLVGSVYLAAAFFVASRVAGRARVWRDGDNYSSGGAESVWNVSWLRQFWVGGGSSWTA